MKRNSERPGQRVWTVTMISLALLLLFAAPQSALAQSNTFPNTGNVGIGMASPGRLLSLSANGQPGLEFADTRGSSGNQAAGFVYDGGLSLTSPGVVFQDFNDTGAFLANRFTFFKNGSINFGGITAPATAGQVIFTGGNVGIGTTSPSNKLTVFGSASDVDVKLQTTNTGTTSTDGFNLGDENATQDAFINQRENAAMRFFANGAERITLKPDGNVGIGTATPGYKLDVAGAINATGLNINGSPITSSQWATSGATINYGAGNVGIGTTLLPVTNWTSTAPLTRPA